MSGAPENAAHPFGGGHPSPHGSLFRLGSRVAFPQLQGFSFGTVLEVLDDGIRRYRIDWDDGWADATDEQWYIVSELVSEDTARGE